MFEKWAEKFREKSKEQEISFKPYPEEAAMPAVKEEPSVKTSSTIAADRNDDQSNIELKLVRPESFDDVSTIADYLLENCTVVINFEDVDGAAKIRMLDFLNGVTYSTDGEIKQISQSTFIITPHNVDVSDD